MEKIKYVVRKPLILEHLEDLRKSGITEETARRAGWYSVPADQMQEKLGRRRGGDVRSALAIPYGAGFERYKVFPYYLDGDGHKIKYLQKAGSPVRVFIPPQIKSFLNDVSKALYITEGEKKALKAAQENLCCVGMGGIWNFKRKGADGLIPDFQEIPMKGRQVVIVPDSDFKSNRGIVAAVRTLGRELEKLGAVVAVIPIPSDDETKVGLDDYLVKEGIDKFLTLPKMKLTDDAFQSNKGNHPYIEHNNQICYKKYDGENVIYEPLGNFTAKAVEEVTHDDGEEKTTHVTIVGTLHDGEPLPEISVPLQDFLSMRWMSKLWGFRVITRAGQSMLDKTREAIQRLSPELVKKHVFTHTGWRKVLNKMVFLHSGGAIGADGLRVELEPGLAQYKFPSVWDKKQLREAAAETLNFLEVAPLSITLPIFAVIHLAVLATGISIDFAIWLLGATGTLKSTLAALALSFFGEFSRKTLPGSWDSTENALLKKCFTLKDLPYVIDDYSPPSNAEMARVREKQAERVIRSIGNISGRDRLRSDLSSRPAHRPRCLLIVTGEQLPTGQSLLARICPITISKDSIDKKKLTKIQARASLLPIYMADFIAQCAKDYDKIIADVKADFIVKREIYQSEAHSRIPEILAWLHIGVELGLKNLSRFCEPRVIRHYKEKAPEVFMALGRQLARTQKDERESFRFLNTIWVLLRQGQLNLRVGFQSCVGWADEEYLYLRPEPSYNAVCQYLRNENAHFGLKPTMLHKMLFEDGLLVKSNEQNRYAIKETNPAKAQERVLKLPLNKLEALFGPLPRS